MADNRTNAWKPIDGTGAGIDNKYVNQAANQLDGNYNTQLNTAQNQLTAGLSNLEASKGGINKNFDGQITENKNNTIKTQNAHNNSMLNRSLGRSSIATTGHAQIDATGQRVNSEIEQGRATALSDVDKQKTDAQLKYDSYAANMEAERMEKILSLARTLQEEERAREREEYWKQKDYELRLQQAKKSSGGGGGYRGGYRNYGYSSGSSSSNKTSSSSSSGYKAPSGLQQNTNPFDRRDQYSGSVTNKKPSKKPSIMESKPSIKKPSIKNPIKQSVGRR